METPKPQRLILKTYLQMLRNSRGTELFRNLYIRPDTGKETDVMADGAYSCAFFASSVLTLFGQNAGFHGTIESTVKDLQEHGWRPADPADPQPGDVLVWEPWEFEGRMHEHLGFCIGDGRAISTSYKEKRVVEHPVSDGRKLTAVWRQANWPS